MRGVMAVWPAGGDDVASPPTHTPQLELSSGRVGLHVIDPRGTHQVRRPRSSLQPVAACRLRREDMKAVPAGEKEMEVGKKAKEGEIKAENGKAEVYDVGDEEEEEEREDEDEPEEIVDLDGGDDDNDDEDGGDGEDDVDEEDTDDDDEGDEEDDYAEEFPSKGSRPQVLEEDDDEEEEDGGVNGGDDGDDDSDADDDGGGEEENEELGIQNIVKPVVHAEDEEDSIDFEPGDEIDEDDDTVDGFNLGLGGSESIKDGTSSKRKRSAKDDDDDDDGEDDDDDAKQ